MCLKTTNRLNIIKVDKAEFSPKELRKTKTFGETHLKRSRPTGKHYKIIFPKELVQVISERDVSGPYTKMKKINKRLRPIERRIQRYNYISYKKFIQF